MMRLRVAHRTRGMQRARWVRRCRRRFCRRARERAFLGVRSWTGEWATRRRGDQGWWYAARSCDQTTGTERNHKTAQHGGEKDGDPAQKLRAAVGV